MQSKPRVVICGQSIFAHALEAALQGALEADVVRLHPHLPSIVARIVDLRPALVLVERGDTQLALMFALLNAGLPVVRLDTELGQGTLFTGQPVTLTSQPDLDQLLEQLPAAVG